MYIQCHDNLKNKNKSDCKHPTLSPFSSMCIRVHYFKHSLQVLSNLFHIDLNLINASILSQNRLGKICNFLWFKIKYKQAGYIPLSIPINTIICIFCKFSNKLLRFLNKSLNKIFFFLYIYMVYTICDDRKHLHDYLIR